MYLPIEKLFIFLEFCNRNVYLNWCFNIINAVVKFFYFTKSIYNINKIKKHYSNLNNYDIIQCVEYYNTV